MPMIIANVSRSRRSCRSSLTTIEPSLRRLTGGLPGFDGRRNEDVLEIRRRRLDLRGAGLPQACLDVLLQVAVAVAEHAQRCADLRDGDDARQAVERAMRATRLRRRDEPGAARQSCEQVLRR